MSTSTNQSDVLVGIDGSERGVRATRYAALEAARLHQRLTMVHVIPDYVALAAGMRPVVPDDMEAVGRSVLREAEREAVGVTTELATQTVLRAGDPVKELLDASRDAGLVVLGHESVTSWRRVFTGAVTMGLAGRARCPVISVPAEWPGESEPFGTIVAGFKTASHDEALLEGAFDAATRRGAKLTVLHAWELPGCYDDIIVRRTHDAEWNLAALERIEAQISWLRADHPRVKGEVHVVHTQPALALREASLTADLLLLGRRSGPGPMSLGGTARALLREAACPVEIVPPSAGHSEDAPLELESAGVPLK